MFSIIIHKRNPNQHHHELALHTCRDDYNQNHRKGLRASHSGRVLPTILKALSLYSEPQKNKEKLKSAIVGTKQRELLYTVERECKLIQPLKNVEWISSDHQNKIAIRSSVTLYIRTHQAHPRKNNEQLMQKSAFSCSMSNRPQQSR